MARTVITILVLRQMVLSPEGSESRWCFGIYSNPRWCCGTPCPPALPQNDAKSEKSTQKIAKTYCSSSQTNQPLTTIVLYSLCNLYTFSIFDVPGLPGPSGTRPILSAGWPPAKTKKSPQLATTTRNEKTGAWGWQPPNWRRNFALLRNSIISISCSFLSPSVWSNVSWCFLQIDLKLPFNAPVTDGSAPVSCAKKTVTLSSVLVTLELTSELL